MSEIVDEKPKDSETKPDEVPKTTTGYGVDDQGFFRMMIHTDRGICELLGFLEQMKDVVKAFYTEQHMSKEVKKQQKKIIIPGIQGILKGLKR